MADYMKVSIYTQGHDVWLTVHDGHREERHARLTPAKAKEIADTLLVAAMNATVHSKWLPNAVDGS